MLACSLVTGNSIFETKLKAQGGVVVSAEYVLGTSVYCISQFFVFFPNTGLLGYWGSFWENTKSRMVELRALFVMWFVQAAEAFALWMKLCSTSMLSSSLHASCSLAVVFWFICIFKAGLEVGLSARNASQSCSGVGFADKSLIFLGL